MKKGAINFAIITTLLIGGQAVDILPISTTVVAQAATKTGTVTATSLRVRSGAGTNYKQIGSLSKGAKVTIISTSNGWHKINYGSGYGYVSADYVTIDSNKPKPSTTADKVIEKAKEYKGVPYVWGGKTPDGFDCSGFTKYVFGQCGVTIGDGTKGQIKNGTAVSKISSLKKGDLIFFKDTYEGCVNPSHVGIYMGNNEFIHASSSKGVTISTLNNYYTQHFYAGRRVL